MSRQVGCQCINCDNISYSVCSGAPLWGYLADVHGRWAIILASAWTVLIASVISALVPDIESMLVARSIMGIGIGGIPVCFSLFMEYIPSDTRGMWGVIIDGIWWAIGSVAQAGLAYAVLPSLGWRWLLLISSTPLLLFVVLFFFFGRESPRYLLSKGRVAEAERLLDRMLQVNGKAGTQPVKLVPFAGVHTAPDAQAGGSLGADVPSEHSALVAGADAEEVQGGSLHSRADGDSADAATTTSAAVYSAPSHTSTPPAAGPLAKLLNSVSGCTDGVGDTFAALFTGPGMARLTSAVWVLWLANAMTYYGIVLLAVRALPLRCCHFRPAHSRRSVRRLPQPFKTTAKRTRVMGSTAPWTKVTLSICSSSQLQKSPALSLLRGQLTTVGSAASGCKLSCSASQPLHFSSSSPSKADSFALQFCSWGVPPRWVCSW